jgi:hypothetical protein
MNVLRALAGTLERLPYNERVAFADVEGTIETLLGLIGAHEQFFRFFPLERQDSQFAVRRLPERRAERSFSNDRVFPLEGISKDGFAGKTDVRFDNVLVHTGSFADEYARSFNALAVTIANEIFFRHGAYMPETEEGRKTLAHELTHVAQHAEKRITSNVTERELEEEAELAEACAASDLIRYVTIDLNGRSFTMPESKMQEFADGIARGIMKWLVERKALLGEREYALTRFALENWLGEE